MDDVTWAALAWTLTLLGGIWTWYAFRRRGVASGLRGAGLTLLPLAAWLTGTLELVTDIGSAFADWATHLVLSPTVWFGLGVGALAALLLVASGVARSRSAQAGPAAPPAVGAAPPKGSAPVLGAGDTGVDPEMAEIEALLRKRGIT